VLRKRTDDQLDNIESAHRFAQAVFYANNGEIRFASKEEQQLTEACKRFIQNSIICCNYLYLTQLVVKTDPLKTILEVIASSSPLSWQSLSSCSKTTLFLILDLLLSNKLIINKGVKSDFG